MRMQHHVWSISQAIQYECPLSGVIIRPRAHDDTIERTFCEAVTLSSVNGHTPPRAKDAATDNISVVASRPRRLENAIQMSLNDIVDTFGNDLDFQHHDER